MKNKNFIFIVSFLALTTAGCSPFRAATGRAGKASPTPPPASDCVQPTSFAWSVGANTCVAAGCGTILNGESVVKTDSSDPTLGSATYSCAAGVITGPITTTCVATATPPPPPPPETCGVAVLTWMNPTLLVDGNPITNLAGNKIYYGKVPGVYSNQIVYSNNGVGQEYSYTIEGLEVGATYYFAATAFLATGEESVYAGPVSKSFAGCIIERFTLNW